MSRKNFKMIWQGPEFDKKRIVQIGNLLVQNSLAHQVRAAHIADKKNVSGQNKPGFSRARQIRNKDRYGMRGMAWRVHDLQASCSGLQHSSFGQRCKRKCCGRVRMHTNGRASARRQFMSAGNMICMNMGINNMGNAHTFFTGNGQVVVNITFGINNNHLSFGRAAKNIGKTA